MRDPGEDKDTGAKAPLLGGQRRCVRAFTRSRASVGQGCGLRYDPSTNTGTERGVSTSLQDPERLHKDRLELDLGKDGVSISKEGREFRVVWQFEKWSRRVKSERSSEYLNQGIKINLKWIKGLKKTLHLEENNAVNFHDFGLGHGFLDMTPRA